MGAKTRYGGGNLGEVTAMAWAEAHGGKDVGHTCI